MENREKHAPSMGLTVAVATTSQIIQNYSVESAILGMCLQCLMLECCHVNWIVMLEFFTEFSFSSGSEFNLEKMH